MAGKRVILAGGSGFLGRSLSCVLANHGYEPIVLSRSPENVEKPARGAYWDGTTVSEWASVLHGAAGVFNLAGKSVNCRYTPENRREINESRVNSVRAINEAVAQCADPPRVLVQASSLAIYGDAGARACDEAAPPGSGFPVETCLVWESAFDEHPTPRTRRVVLRIGFVLGPNGGALATLAALTRCFLGGTVGSGSQYISWIHQSDMNRMFLRALERDDVEGVYNATSANPVTNAEFMRSLRHALRRPWSPPVPAAFVRIGSRFMGTEPSLALTGRRCMPTRFTEQGFEFTFPYLDSALGDIYG